MTDQQSALFALDNLDEDAYVCRCPRCQRQDPRWPDWIGQTEAWPWRQIETVKVSKDRL